MNLVGTFLGLAIMHRGENLSARVNSQCVEKTVKCIGLVLHVPECVHKAATALPMT